MSSIKVWTSDGNWSEAVKGCDKIHLMKKAIELECSNLHHDCKKNRSLIHAKDIFVISCSDGEVEYYCRSGLQVDNEVIDLDRLIDSEWQIDFENVSLSDASFFKMRLSTLREMADAEETMSAVYNKLINLAKVPEKEAKNYCLFFMFANE